MLRRIIHFSVNNRLIIAALTLGLILAGIWNLRHLPIDAVPDITNNQVQIITHAPALGAVDVERIITAPLELSMVTISGMEEMRSISRVGFSVITCVFKEGVDIYWARQQVSERIQQIQPDMPEGTAEMAPVTTGLGEVYQYVLKPKPGYEDKISLAELRTIQDWIVRRQLLGVEGVADVSSFGGYKKEYEVALHPQSLAAYNLTVNDIFEALARNNQNTGSAYIEKGPQAYSIRSEGLVTSLEDIGNVVVRNQDNGAPLLIRDVADVRMGHAVRYGSMIHNGGQEVAGAVVMMLKGANSAQVVENVKKRMETIVGNLPEGVMVIPFLERTKMLESTIHTVSKNLIEGALIVILVLFLFLGDWRAALLVSSVIPLSMLFAFIMMNIFGVSGNLMSLGALDFGLIVDGTVIIVEGVLQGMHGRKTPDTRPQSARELVVATATRMARPAIFGTLIILIVYIPIFTLQGIEGKMFRPMAQTVAFALLGAFILSLTYVPMMTGIMAQRGHVIEGNFSDRFIERLQRGYRRLLDLLLPRPKMVLGAAIALLGIAAFIQSRAGGEFLPQLEEGDFAIGMSVLPGSNLQTSNEAVRKVSKILLKEFPEVIDVVSKTGNSEIPTDPMPMEATDLIVTLKPKKEWTSARGFPELADKMQEKLSVVPGVTFGFLYPVQMRFNELMTGAKQDVVCKIFGDDLDILAEKGEQLGKMVQRLRGAADVYLESQTGLPQVVINYNRSAMAAYGVDVSTLNDAVNAAYAGHTVGKVYEGERFFDLVVRMDSTSRLSSESLGSLLVAGRNGKLIPLAQLATINEVAGPGQIQRENNHRRIVVGFNVRGRDVQSIVKELNTMLDKELKLPTGYYVTVGGSFENLEAARSRLAIVLPMALLLIFFMLYIAFNSVRDALIIYTAIPLAAVGGIFLLAIAGMPFSISAAVGFIALFGVVVLNGIVLLTEFRRLEEHGGLTPLQIVMKGGTNRLRPVLMTAAVASLGFLPMALSRGAGAEVQRPLATVVIGGIFTSTTLTLFVLPILYMLIHRKRKTNTPPAAAIATMLGLLLLVPGNSQAQTPLSYAAAVDTALRNNLELKETRFRENRMRELKKTAFATDAFSITSELGQINSPLFDTKFEAAQSISLPMVYRRRAGTLSANWQAAQSATGMKENELRRAVGLKYFEIVAALRKRKLLDESDSTYRRLVRVESRRARRGEENQMGEARAEMALAEIERQRIDLERDIQIGLLEYNLLLNARLDYTVDTAQRSPEVYNAPADFNPDMYPAVMEAQWKKRAAQWELKSERSTLYPTFMAGYANQSFRGEMEMNGQTVFVSGNQRYHSAVAGISFPLLWGSRRAGVRAAIMNLRESETQYDARLQAYETQRRSALAAYEASKRYLSSMVNRTLPGAARLRDLSAMQLQAGETTYEKYIEHLNIFINARAALIDADNRLISDIIQLNSLYNQ